jgi:death-on-curing protein
VPKRRRKPTWIDRVVIDAIQLDQLREHGGLPGLRDENALESALARPQNRWHYEPDTDLADLAAAHGWGLTTSHPYRDGNKRAAFLAMATFVELNGYELKATDTEVVQVMVAVANHGMGERELADWARTHLARKR